MRILLITPIYLPHIGGIEKYVNDLANHLLNGNHEVTIFAADQTINKIIVENENGIKIYRVPVFSLSGILILKNIHDKILLKKILRNNEIVHSNDCKFLYTFLAKYKQKCKYKLFLSSHGFIFHTNNNSFFKELYFKNIVVKRQKSFDKIICVSEQDTNIAKKYGLKNIVTIFPGVNIHKYQDLPKAINSIITFFYWGRIARNKGIKECLEKICKLDNFSFNLIGKCEDNEYQEILDSIIIRNNKQDSVHFLGPRSDEEIRNYMSKCDFILMPSLHEGFGMTLAECLLSNKKIIANTNTSFIKILRDTNLEDYLFDFEDPNSDINNKINYLINKQIEPENVEQFSIEEMFKKIDLIYFNLDGSK